MFSSQFEFSNVSPVTSIAGGVRRAMARDVYRLDSDYKIQNTAKNNILRQPLQNTKYSKLQNTTANYKILHTLNYNQLRDF